MLHEANGIITPKNPTASLLSTRSLSLLEWLGRARLSDFDSSHAENWAAYTDVCILSLIALRVRLFIDRHMLNPAWGFWWHLILSLKVSNFQSIFIVKQTFCNETRLRSGKPTLKIIIRVFTLDILCTQTSFNSKLILELYYAMYLIPSIPVFGKFNNSPSIYTKLLILQLSGVSPGHIRQLPRSIYKHF